MHEHRGLFVETFPFKKIIQFALVYVRKKATIQMLNFYKKTHKFVCYKLESFLKKVRMGAGCWLGMKSQNGS
jgi:hypothetical protein